MLFCFICMDKPGSAALRADTRPTHLAYLDKFMDRIAIAGPLQTEDRATPTGSLMILDFGSREEADTFARNDPYAKAGLFESVTVTPFKKVFPTPS